MGPFVKSYRVIHVALVKVVGTTLFSKKILVSELWATKCMRILAYHLRTTIEKTAWKEMILTCSLKCSFITVDCEGHTCKSDGVCVDEKNVCDKILDCEDGSDEVGCRKID